MAQFRARSSRNNETYLNDEAALEASQKEEEKRFLIAQLM